jgi:hypothetical protein
MADFDDIPFAREPELQPPAPPPSGPPLWPPITAGVVLLALAALWYFGTRGNPAPPATTQPGVAETTVDLPKQPARPTAEPGESIELPPLDESDALVRTLVGRFDYHEAAVVPACAISPWTSGPCPWLLQPSGSFDARLAMWPIAVCERAERTRKSGIVLITSIAIACCSGELMLEVRSP